MYEYVHSSSLHLQADGWPGDVGGNLCNPLQRKAPSIRPLLHPSTIRLMQIAGGLCGVRVRRGAVLAVVRKVLDGYNSKHVRQLDTDVSTDVRGKKRCARTSRRSAFDIANQQRPSTCDAFLRKPPPRALTATQPTRSRPLPAELPAHAHPYLQMPRACDGTMGGRRRRWWWWEDKNMQTLTHMATCGKV